MELGSRVCDCMEQQIAGKGIDVRKIVQVATAMQAPSQTRDDVRNVEDEFRVVALCKDGSLWAIRPDTFEAKWDRLPDIPDEP